MITSFAVKSYGIQIIICGDELYGFFPHLAGLFFYSLKELTANAFVWAKGIQRYDFKTLPMDSVGKDTDDSSFLFGEKARQCFKMVRAGRKRHLS